MKAPPPSKVAKQIAKAFAAQAARTTPVFNPAALDAAIERRRQQQAERDAARTQIAASLSVHSAEPKSVSTVVPEVMSALEAFASRARLSSAAELRAYYLRTEVLPRLEHWGFEKRFRHELTDWQCREQVATFQVCQMKLTGVGAVVALIGKRGTGKTTIASQIALARAWKEQQEGLAGGPKAGTLHTVAYRKVTSLVRRLKPLYANFGAIDIESVTESLKHLCEVEVLVIDEMHDLSELAVREAMLIDLIDRRYAACRDTLIISNQTEEEWDTQTPISIQSRIQEHGCILKCEWNSWREKGGS
jgi:DNA replication protein DnaC